MELKGQESEAVESINGRAIIDIEREGVLLIKRKSGHFVGKWELPGGKLFGQNKEEELAREIREETGLEVNPNDLVKVLFYGVVDERAEPSFFNKDPKINEHLFMVKLKKTDVPVINIGDEHSSFTIVDEAQFKEGSFEGSLTTLTKTALSVYFYDIKKRSLSGKPLLVEGPVWEQKKI